MKDVDIVVIGSGLGGLSTATALSKAGKKVRVLEKHNVPGGYATTFTRGRFEFDASLHQMCGVGTRENPGILWGLFESWGLHSKVEFVQTHEFYRCKYPGLDVIVPVGRENFTRTMAQAFPDDESDITQFINAMFDFADEALEFIISGRKLEETNDEEYPYLKKYGQMTVNEVLLPMVKNERARIVLSQFCNYIGQAPSRVAFLGYAIGFANYVKVGPSHVRGKSQALSQGMADIITESGGEVWLNNGVKKIMVSDGKVTGVVTEDETEISCEVIVSNVNPFTTAYDLVGKEKVPDWYLQRIGKWSPGTGTINIFLGLNKPHQEFGLPTHELFYSTTMGDWAKVDEALMSRVDYEPMGIGITSYCIADNTFSPPGTSVIVVTLGGYGEPWKKLSPVEYIEAKDRWAEKGLQYLETLIPDIRNHIEVMEVATPLTNQAYSGNPGGSYMGFMEARQVFNIEKLPFRGPLEGLYFCGAWVDVGGGYLPTLLSGMHTSNKVLEDMNLPDNGRQYRKEWAETVQKEQVGETGISEKTLEAARGVALKFNSTRITFRIEKITIETPSAKTFRLQAVDGPLPYFRAGQYINLFVEIDGVLTSRPYTIASSPGKQWYDITVRRKEGGFVSLYFLDQVKEGDILTGTIPSGDFYYNPVIHSRQLVLLAGGCGITPFMSMVREAADRNSPLDIHLLYGSREPSDIIFRQEIESLAATSANIKADFVISEPVDDWTGPKGFLDAEMITSLAGSLQGKTVFVCGPPLMYDLCEKALEKLNMPKNQVVFEMSGLPDDVSMEQGWPGLSTDLEFEVVEERSGKRFPALAGEPLMVSLERAGIVIPAVCRSGACTACRTRLLSGKVFVPDSVHVRQSDHKANYIHACMSYPLENLNIRI